MFSKEVEKILKEITQLGHELEGVDYNHKFEGYEGFERATLGKERKSLRQKAIYRIRKLENMGISVFGLDYSYEENGVVFELDYALQFI